jgi:hypothetical protein
MVGAGEFGRLSWNWISGSRLSKTARQNETAQANDVSPGRTDNLHMDYDVRYNGFAIGCMSD